MDGTGYRLTPRSASRREPVATLGRLVSNVDVERILSLRSSRSAGPFPTFHGRCCDLLCTGNSS